MSIPSTLVARFDRIQQLLDSAGGQCTPEEFQRALNLIFHRHESQHYDRVHRHMWKSLPRVLSQLVQPIAMRPMSRLAVIDIGCGTGLATSLLLESAIGRNISSVLLVDTSPEMLELARRRLHKRAGDVRFQLGSIDQVEESFDLAVMSSVMHHIPDLAAFLPRLTTRLKPRGILLHLQDPNGDADTSVVDARRRELALYERNRRVTLWDRIKYRIGRRDDYLEQVNKDLLAQRLILRPLTPVEIWSITDIHDDDHGISFNEMKAACESLAPVKKVSYAFFGKMESELPNRLRSREIALFEENDLNGTIMGGVWTKVDPTS